MGRPCVDAVTREHWTTTAAEARQWQRRDSGRGAPPECGSKAELRMPTAPDHQVIPGRRLHVCTTKGGYVSGCLFRESRWLDQAASQPLAGLNGPASRARSRSSDPRRVRGAAGCSEERAKVLTVLHVNDLLVIPPTGLADGFGRGVRPTAGKDLRIHPRRTVGPRLVEHDSAGPLRCHPCGD
ncbi:MAG: hypothetical protein JWP76_3916 [Dactylosporangium sp.]|nr:hypothetical protein [Dactylosporangium sp.]